MKESADHLGSGSLKWKWTVRTRITLSGVVVVRGLRPDRTTNERRRLFRGRYGHAWPWCCGDRAAALIRLIRLARFVVEVERLWKELA
jgi:hypothetical protein